MVDLRSWLPGRNPGTLPLRLSLRSPAAAGKEPAESPRSTQELAPLLGITQAALSKQLRRLTEASVLQPRREGYYVVYSLVTGRIARLSPDLLAMLGAVEPPP
jgi:DNA-binding transcriptional ArsR family regulator